MTVVVLARHGHIHKANSASTSTPTTESNMTDPTHDWPLSELGIQQSRILGKELIVQGIIPAVQLLNTSNTLGSESIAGLDTIFGDQLRLRHSLYHVLDAWGEFGNLCQSYKENYLNGRLRQSNVKQTDDLQIAKASWRDESFSEYVRRGPERFFDRVRRRANEISHFLAMTTREFIIATRFRLEAPDRTTVNDVLGSLSQDGQTPTNDFDIACGEALVIADINPDNESGQPGKFRWLKRISPSHPDRNLDWQAIRVRKFSKDELIQGPLWNS